jgi:hypothetical protein
MDKRGGVAGAVFGLVALHNGAGQEVFVNPREVTNLQGPKTRALFVKHVHCLVGFSDGKFVTVTETCEAVRELFEKEH